MILKRVFLNESIVLIIIILNAIVLFLIGFDEFVEKIPELLILDNIFTFIFLIELIVKLKALGLGNYFKDNWNTFDFILIILAIPSLLFFLFDVKTLDLDFFLVFRILRVFKFFRFLRFVPKIDHLINGVMRAGKASLLIVVGFFIFNFTVSLFTTFLFKSMSSEYFGNPLISLYSTFKLFTVEGWYDIPDSITQNQSAFITLLIRLYFVVILFFGGIFGLSLVNSIFVDAMISDNNNELEDSLKRLEKKIDILSRELKK